jgi:hypothetical protein
MLRKRANLTDIGQLVTDKRTIIGDAEIKTEIQDFYRCLYEEEQVSNIDDMFFQHVQKIDKDTARKLTMPLTKKEIYNVLKTCKDSTSGPDGIP